MTSERYRAVVLAGDRGPGDPLAAHAGVAGKVLVPIAGRPMLDRVLEAIAGARLIGKVTVVCRGDDAYARILKAHAVEQRLDPQAGPAASAASALDRIAEDQPVLIATGDHPLLRPAWLDAFVDAARRSGADAAVGVVDHDRILQRFPGHRRTRYRFADVSVCGTNLFFVAGRSGRKVVGMWRGFEADRKKPWRIIARLGWRNLARYALGRLELDQAAAALSSRLGARIAAIRIDDPEAAVDVDSLEDLAFVERLMAER